MVCSRPVKRLSQEAVCTWLWFKALLRINPGKHTARAAAPPPPGKKTRTLFAAGHGTGIYPDVHAPIAIAVANPHLSLRAHKARLSARTITARGPNPALGLHRPEARGRCWLPEAR